MIYLDPNSELGRKVAELRAEEMRRLGRKFANFFRKLFGTQPLPAEAVNTNEND